MSLKPIQLEALANCRLANIGVGQGKTLLGFLFPVVMGAKQTVVLTKPSLIDQAVRHYEEYINHWRLPRLAQSSKVSKYASPGLITLVSYSSLSSIKQADVLEKLAPSLIVCDEAHCLARSTAARTKRFKRYFKSHPNTQLVAMSGSLISRSIKNVAHLSALALGKGSPFPLDWPTLEEWSLALDPSELPSPAGALQEFCKPGENVVEGFHRRVFQTPGVVSSGAGSLDCSLVLKPFKPTVCDEIHKLLKKQDLTWETPDGEVITDALTKWRHDGELSCGFYYRRTWPRQEPRALQMEWLEARCNYRREVATYLKHRSAPGLDSPKLLDMAARSGKWKSEFFQAWQDIKPKAVPSRETVWVSNELVDTVVAWGHDHTPSVIWYEHQAFGEALAKATGWIHITPSPEGQQLLAKTLKSTVKTPIIASRHAYGTGTDGLQFITDTQLFVFPPSGPTAWEQTLGRVHRQGQVSLQVESFVSFHTEPAREAFRNAVKAAQFIKQFTGTDQKLVYADKEGELL